MKLTRRGVTRDSGTVCLHFTDTDGTRLRVPLDDDDVAVEICEQIAEHVEGAGSDDRFGSVWIVGCRECGEVLGEYTARAMDTARSRACKAKGQYARFHDHGSDVEAMGPDEAARFKASHE